MTEFEQHCHQNRQRIRALPLNDQYQQRVEYQGRIYYYDPDYDCFYPHVDYNSLSHWERWGWIYMIWVLGVISWWVS